MAASSMIGDGARRGGRALAFAYGTALTAAAALALGVTLFGNRHAGEPVVEIPIHLRPVARAVPKPPPAEATAPSPDEALSVTGQKLALAAPPQAPPGPPPAPAPAVTGSVAVADPALIEKTPQGPLPRIADNGTPPFKAYASPAAINGRPRIGIVISGLGMSAKSTEAAINTLPAGVTVAFFPYAIDVQRWVTLARQKGHEVLLEVPMEPYDFPDSDPGQYTLRTGIGEDANTKRLVWSLTRFTGYVGVTNLLGGRLLSDAGALEPMLTYLTRRGLLFFDNGSALHSVAADVAARVGVPFCQATMTIDSIQSAMEIDRRLSDLETEARTKGSAAGSGFLYPVTVERVNVWAHGLAGRGFVLAPVSAIVATGKS